MDKYNSLLRAICLFLLSYIFGVLVYEYIHKETPSAIDVYRGGKVNLYAVIYVILYTVSPMILNYVAEKKMMLFT